MFDVREEGNVYDKGDEGEEGSEEGGKGREERDGEVGGEREE